MSTELNLHTSPIDLGLTVIEASAGTGKTYSISHLVPRLLLEGALPDVSKLLLVTFTKDAARELSDRVRRVLTQLAAPPSAEELAGTSAHDIALLRPLLENPDARARLQRALLDLDLLAVSTIHAFCQRTLQQEGSLCGIPVLPEVVTNDAEHLDPIVRRHWIDTLSADPVLATLATAQGWDLDDTLRFINTCRRCLHPQIEPATADYSKLRAELTTLHQVLSSRPELDALLARLSPITAWNKNSSLADVTAWLTDFSAQSLESPSFWDALDAVQDLPAYIKKNKAQTPVRDDLPHLPWFAAAQKLHVLTRQLHWAWQQHLAALAIPELAAFMARHRLITQDGLIGALFHALHRHGDATAVEQSTRLANRLADRYHVALIDESQDTDPRQFAIFKRIFLDAESPRRLLLVGDPKQAIYGFRGADLSTYLAARDSARVTYTLSHTRRAPQPLVAALNTLFQRPRAFLNPGMTFTPTQSALAHDHQLFRDGVPCSRLEVWIVPPDEASAYSAKGRRIPAVSRVVANTIVDLLNHRSTLVKTDLATRAVLSSIPVTPAHFAVLVATHEQATAMAAALQLRGVPAVINSGADVFATEEASDLHLLLTGILDPRRTGRLRRALATRLLGLDAAVLAASDQAPSDNETHASWLKRFTDWHDLWQRRSLVALLADFEKPSAPHTLGITQRLALIPLTGERRVTNYRHLTDLLLDAAREVAARPDELVRWLGQQIAAATDRSDAEERQLQLSSDRAAVQVVTMHKSKGLEYPLVFCPYLADSLKLPKGYEKLPSASAPGAAHTDTLLNLELLDDDARAQRQTQLVAAQLEERLRLAYVALTRAQARAWTFSYRSSKGYDDGSPLDWLLRSDAELTTHPGYSADWVELAIAGGPARHQATLESFNAAPDLTFGPPPDLPSEPLNVAGSASDPTPSTFSSTSAAASAAPSEALAKEGLHARPVPHVPRSWRITSFSTLTREQHAHGAPTISPILPPAAASAAPSEASAKEAPLFLTSPAGASVGTVVHDWIESWNFSELPPISDPENPLSRYLASVNLPAPRPDQAPWPAALHELFATLRLIRLPGCGATPLHELCPDAHGSEWHFHLPLSGSLSAKKLAACFATHAAPAHRSYAPLLEALSDDEFHGLLQGFIDRLARHGDAWGVIDWKTNRLGATLADYDDDALLRCAMDAHYLLQTHLYLVALRRYLRGLGLTDAPLGGAWLVFLRALAPGSTRGVLHIDPPAAMLDALDALFAPAARSDLALA